MNHLEFLGSMYLVTIVNRKLSCWVIELNLKINWLVFLNSIVYLLAIALFKHTSV